MVDDSYHKTSQGRTEHTTNQELHVMVSCRAVAHAAGSAFQPSIWCCGSTSENKALSPCFHCAGTNFLIRAAAFKEAGWSPEYTLTEDFALGMELKKRRWQCRYVEEYLAVGEAPDEVRNCFQQRSRWAKGVRPPVA